MVAHNRQPLFPVASASTLSAEENLKALAPLCHVVEVKEGFALVHASPMGCVKITELGMAVYPAAQGNEYYAVKIGLGETAPKERVRRMGISRIEIKGGQYIVQETPTKRKQDVMRFEIRKDGPVVSQPYVVSFQDAQGHTGQCSCPDWIYRRKVCKHIAGVQSNIVTKF